MTVVNMSSQTNKDQSNKEDTVKEVQETTHTEDYSNWGYDLYPDRTKHKGERKITDYMFGKGRDRIEKIRCERNVYQCVKTSPLVKLMMGALKSSGCSIDIRRHISCEECADGVTGGYDPILNQVSIIYYAYVCEYLVKGHVEELTTLVKFEHHSEISGTEAYAGVLKHVLKY